MTMLPGLLKRAAIAGAFVLLLPFALFAQAQGAPKTLRVAAAADLEPVLPALFARFEQTTGVHAEATYQSSATLAQQIINGAPFDIFFAADTGFPQHVIDAKLAVESAPVPYARGTLVLWARKDSPALKGGALSMDTLHNPALQSVAMANPATAPYGRAAQAAIEHLGLQASLKPKLRIAANIAQTAQYADSGNAEVGFLSLTGAKTPKLIADGSFVPVPPDAYPPILQGAVILRHAQDQPDAERFLEFLKTPESRSLLEQKGLMAPGP